MENRNNYKLYRLFKWLVIVAGGGLVLVGLGTANYIEQTSHFSLASVFMILAIFFHLEQHKSK